MKYTLHLVIGCITATLLAVVTTNAQVIVNADDIGDESTYVFSINAETFSEEGTWAERSNNAIVSLSGVQYLQEGSGAQYIYANPGGTYGEFVMQWDFSNSGYRPLSVDLSNLVLLLGGQEIGSIYSIEVSTDGANYTSILELTANGNHQIYIPFDDTVDISDSAVSFYQRVVFTAPTGFNDVYSQWGRVENSSASTQVFGATFTVAAVPEPSVWASLLLGAAILGLVGKRGTAASKKSS